MGSEAVPQSPSIAFHLTGFKKFHNVTDNPTEVLVGNVTDYMKARELPFGAIIGSCTVLETAGAGALDFLLHLLDSPPTSSKESKNLGKNELKLLESVLVPPASSKESKNCGKNEPKLLEFVPGASTSSKESKNCGRNESKLLESVPGAPTSSKESKNFGKKNELKPLESVRGNGVEVEQGGRVVWVHFGVNSGACRFAVEQRAVNEATFRCPDEMGWQPDGLPIVAEDGAVSNVRETKLPASKIVAELVKLGFDTVLSFDAGRFVCNYVYYQSLRHAANDDTKCLFVHVPPFAVIHRHIQMEFIAALLKVVATCLA